MTGCDADGSLPRRRAPTSSTCTRAPPRTPRWSPTSGSTPTGRRRPPRSPTSGPGPQRARSSWSPSASGDWLGSGGSASRAGSTTRRLTAAWCRPVPGGRGRAEPTAVPVYGRAYPEQAAYPSQIPYQTVTPLQYSIQPGQAYVLADNASADRLLLREDVPLRGRGAGLHRCGRARPLLRDLVRPPHRLRAGGGRTHRARLSEGLRREEARRRLGSPAGFTANVGRSCGPGRRAGSRVGSFVGFGGDKGPAAGSGPLRRVRPRGFPGRSGPAGGGGRSSEEGRPVGGRRLGSRSRGPLHAFARRGAARSAAVTSCGRPMRGRRT